MIVNRKRYSKYVPAKVNVNWLSMSVEKGLKKRQPSRGLRLQIYSFLLVYCR